MLVISDEVHVIHILPVIISVVLLFTEYFRTKKYFLGQPSLAEMTRQAITRLSKNKVNSSHTVEKKSRKLDKIKMQNS
jgi:hypothetical protein